MYLPELMIGAFYYTMGFLMTISESINSDLEVATSYVGTSIMVGSYLLYLIILFARRPNPRLANLMLIIPLTTILVFIIPVIWISGIFTNGQTSDPQYFLDVFELPLKTSWIFLVLGLLHDFVLGIHTANQRWKNRP